MASAAEQLAQNMNFSSFAKAKELQQRILFTIGILIVYRIGTFVPIPGIDPEQYALVFQQFEGGILSMFNTLGGGAVERMAIFALNVMPYISASIIMQLKVAKPAGSRSTSTRVILPSCWPRARPWPSPCR